MSKNTPKRLVEVSPAAPTTVPVITPEELPHDAVALHVWRNFTGVQPMTIVVTRASWDMNKKVVMDGGARFNPDRIYEFESPTNPQGRRTTFHLQDVVSWAASVYTGIVPAPAGIIKG